MNPIDILFVLAHTDLVFFQYGALSGPFGPVVDGVDGILERAPLEIRKSGDFMKIKIIAGFNKDEGAFLAGEGFCTAKKRPRLIFQLPSLTSHSALCWF